MMASLSFSIGLLNFKPIVQMAGKQCPDSSVNHSKQVFDSLLIEIWQLEARVCQGVVAKHALH